MESTFVLLLANALGRVRRETIGSREYIVAEAVLIVPGILNGSGGALLYPEEEVSRNVSAWNGIPITVGHPTSNGIPISARQPSVWKTSKIGEVFSTVFNGKLRSEAWFDVERTRAVDSRILNALRNGTALELSTGLYLDAIPSEGVRDGKKYVAIARNYRPDHLAVLMDGVGACSLKDGCGVLVNGDPTRRIDANTLEPLSADLGRSTIPANNGGETVNREQMIQWLTANCDCWKGKTETLNKLTDDDLRALKANADAMIANRQALADATGALTAVRSGLGINELPAISEIPNLIKSKLTVNAPAPAPAPVPVPTPTPPAPAPSKTFAELLANASPEDQALWAFAQGLVKEKKTALIEAIVNAEGKSDEAKNALRGLYSKMPMADLELRVKYLPAPSAVAPAVNYFPGHPGHPAPANRFAVNEDDLLVAPSLFETNGQN